MMYRGTSDIHVIGDDLPVHQEFEPAMVIDQDDPDEA
jgi:hypothetical protein